MEIKARVVADSLAPNGSRITTFELEYPRLILSEINTHRQLSRNTASSRAIPVAKMIELIRNDKEGVIVHWGKNQSGMQADGELEGEQRQNVQDAWNVAKDIACDLAEYMYSQGAHKQVVNRILEPFQTVKTIATATEWGNFFWLRCHEDAQPEIQELARKMYAARAASTPINLEVGHWHTPYFEQGYWTPDSKYDRETALKVSSSCCAQVSYRKRDDSIEKAQQLYDRLVGASRKHSSAFEHCASPMNGQIGQVGVTHKDIHGNLWSGNFKGWVQYRQLIWGHTLNGEWTPDMENQ